MSIVTGSRITLLFCEGQPDSYDFQILNRLLAGIPNTQVVPVGGKFGLNAFIQGRLSSYPEDNQPSYLGFRDRDFDAEPPSNPALIPWSATKPIFLSYRACIENYLLDPSLIHSYWTQSSQGPKWQYGESPGTDDISVWVRRSAESITDYQAVRWALSRLKHGKRWPEIKTTWTKSSGYLPSSLRFEDCLQEAKQLISTFKGDVARVREDEFEQHLNKYREKFHSEEFWSQQQYLVWFHGKDLQKAMQITKQNSISLTNFFDEATQSLEVTKHPDLVELKNKVQEISE